MAIPSFIGGIFTVFFFLFFFTEYFEKFQVGLYTSSRERKPDCPFFV